MKKVFAAILAACAALSLALFAGCSSEPTAEDFANAKEALDNYTLEFQLSMDTVSIDSTLQIDGESGYLEASMTYSGSTQSVVEYYKVESGTVYSRTASASSWRETSSDSIEDAAFMYAGYVYALFDLDFEDFTYADGYLMATSGTLSAIGSRFDSTISSLQVKVESGKFTEARMVGDYDGVPAEYSYTFSNYGSTSVTLPA